MLLGLKSQKFVLLQIEVIERIRFKCQMKQTLRQSLFFIYHSTISGYLKSLCCLERLQSMRIRKQPLNV